MERIVLHCRLKMAFIPSHKKKHKEKARELDKKLNKASVKKSELESSTDNAFKPDVIKHNKLPWALLILSWLGFVAYIIMAK